MSYQPPTGLPIEFRLALAASRWAYAGDSGDAVAGLAADVDWARFAGTCQRHRVQGLIWHALSRLRVETPAAVRIVLAGDAMTIAEAGLRAAEESKRLIAAFDAASVGC